MMTLDEAIQHALEVAIAKEEEAYEGELQLDSTDIMGCRQCAAEHRQIAKWLTELKVRRDMTVLLEEMIKALKKKRSDELEKPDTNWDYLKGYICALSVVEGIIAKVESEGRKE